MSSEPEFSEPIPCPECGKPLTTIQLEKVTVIEWREREEEEIDDDYRGEFEDNGQGGLTVRCHHCGKVIGHSDSNTAYGIYPNYEDF